MVAAESQAHLASIPHQQSDAGRGMGDQVPLQQQQARIAEIILGNGTHGFCLPQARMCGRKAKFPSRLLFS